MSGALYLLALPLLAYLYVRSNDRKLLQLPQEALAVSPKRWTDEEIKRTADELVNSPPSLLASKLPPKTGRRYIVVGGAGFLGGWMVLHLLARGEDPRRIRVLDIRAPVRNDMKEGPAAQVDLVLVDVTDAKAVKAAFAKPWPVIEGELEPPELTVFHSAANIRFYERHPDLLPFSERINVGGTQNTLAAAKDAGASTFVYTSSGSIAVRRTRLWLCPWESQPSHFVQAINDDDNIVPKQHDHFFSNYAVSKTKAEKLVRAADKTPTSSGVMRTGAVRPGNGIYGPGGDILVGMYITQKKNVTWIPNVMSSFAFVENCSLAHLCFEQRLIELQHGSGNPDIGGHAFNVTDAGPPPTYGDIYRALPLLSKGTISFQLLSLSCMLAIAQLVETYYLARHFLRKSPLAFLARFIPPVVGDVVLLQPSVFPFTNVHLLFDDSRARLPPERGGLGYDGSVTTLQGVCKVWLESSRGGIPSRASASPDAEFDPAASQKAVDEIVDKLEHSFENGEKIVADKIHQAASILKSD